MSTHRFALITVWVVLFAGTPVASAATDPDLSGVKALYAAASYEEALSALIALEPSASPELVEQYRALCLLGLGRTEDAERSLERLVTTSPLYAIPPAEVSPRLVALFDDVRRRTLPAVARNRYTKARADYDAKDFESAAAHLKNVLAIIDNPAADGHTGSLRDLRQLAEGFLTLSDAALAAARQPEQPSVPAIAAQAASATSSAPRIYTAADTEVVAPVQIERALPKWDYPDALVTRRTFQGVLEFVIDERGGVESARMTESIVALYDAKLLDATKQWRFRPAMKDGVPVKYSTSLRVVLHPKP